VTSRHPKPTAAQRLAAAVQRFQRFARADPGHDPEAPEPATDWERAVDDRLRAVEKALANQNRLLLLSLVAILADTVFKIAGR